MTKFHSAVESNVASHPGQRDVTAEKSGRFLRADAPIVATGG